MNSPKPTVASAKKKVSVATAAKRKKGASKSNTPSKPKTKSAKKTTRSAKPAGKQTKKKLATSKKTTSRGTGVKRDAERSKRRILDAALIEFSQKGYSGARVDSIAAQAGVSKPMIYSYYGDKDDLYAAALREAYVQIRVGERELQLENKPPEEAIRLLVSFTLNHFQSKPWFISMLNTENLRGGTTIRKIQDVSEIQSRLLQELKKILERGQKDGVFRLGIDPVDLYITIASLCYFPISNAHTLRAVFNKPVDEEAWLDQRRKDAEELVIRFLRIDASDNKHSSNKHTDNTRTK